MQYLKEAMICLICVWWWSHHSIWHQYHPSRFAATFHLYVPRTVRSMRTPGGCCVVVLKAALFAHPPQLCIRLWHWHHEFSSVQGRRIRVSDLFVLLNQNNYKRDEVNVVRRRKELRSRNAELVHRKKRAPTERMNLRGSPFINGDIHLGSYGK